MRWLGIIVGFFLYSQFSSAEVLRLNIPKAGYPPYLLEKREVQGRGVVFDVLALVAKKHDVDIEVISLPRKRVEQHLVTGRLDASMAAIEWIDNPQLFVFTKPIMKSQDGLFSSTTEPLRFEQVNDLFNKRIATRLGYKYPLIDSHFEQQRIQRLDALTLEAMLKMVLAKRADATIVNRAAGQWLIKNNPKLQNRFMIAEKVINTFDIRLMFNQRWAPFTKQFDQELANLRISGELAKIIARYR